MALILSFPVAGPPRQPATARQYRLPGPLLQVGFELQEGQDGSASGSGSGSPVEGKILRLKREAVSADPLPEPKFQGVARITHQIFSNFAFLGGKVLQHVIGPYLRGNFTLAAGDAQSQPWERPGYPETPGQTPALLSPVLTPAAQPQRAQGQSQVVADDQEVDGRARPVKGNPLAAAQCSRASPLRFM